MSDYLTDTELAEILDMKPTSVRRMIRRGDLPGREIKQGKTLTLKSDFNDWLQEDIPQPANDDVEQPEPTAEPKVPDQPKTNPMSCTPTAQTYYLRRKQNPPDAK